MTSTKLRKWLGGLGLIPFAAGVLLTLLDISVLEVSGSWIFITYSSAILCFLSGTWWGMGLKLEAAKPAFWLQLTSNAFCLLAWFALIHFVQSISILLLMTGYILMWLGDRKMQAMHLWPENYFLLRSILSLLVISAHVVMAYWLF